MNDGAEDAYTRLPMVNSLRFRRRRMMQKPSMSALDLGLGSQVLIPPGFLKAMTPVGGWAEAPHPFDDHLPPPAPNTMPTTSCSDPLYASLSDRYAQQNSLEQDVLEHFTPLLTPPSSPLRSASFAHVQLAASSNCGASKQRMRSTVN